MTRQRRILTYSFSAIFLMLSTTSGAEQQGNSDNIDLLAQSNFGGWNHITNEDKWRTLKQMPPAYAPPSTSSQPKMVLVKKYQDWEQQHSNGLILDLHNPAKFDLDTKLVIRYRITKENTHLLTQQQLLEAFQSQTTDSILRVLDDENAYLECQLRAGETWAFSFMLKVSSDQFDQWQEVQIRLQEMDKWTLENYRRIEKQALDFQGKRIENIMIVAETKTRKVLRNLVNPLPEGYKETFKELALELDQLIFIQPDQ